MMGVDMQPFSLDRMVRAVEKVRERLLRASEALETAGVPYVVVGGNAVGAWVARVDEAAVRNTRDVDILIRRESLGPARLALEHAGFSYRHVAGMDVFLDGPDGKVRDGVHLIFAGEKVRPEEPVANPDVDPFDRADRYRILPLQPLVQIKLTAYRDKDRTHLRDLLEVGLIDESWCGRFLPDLGARLKALIDSPGR